MKTRFRYVLLGPVAKVQNLSNSKLICHSSKCIKEILNNEQNVNKNNLKNYWILKVSKLKPLMILCTTIFIKIWRWSFNKGEYRYQVQLPFTNDHNLLPDNYSHCKSRLENLARKLSSDTDSLVAYSSGIISQLDSEIIEPILKTVSAEDQVHYIPHRPVQ